MSKPLINNIRTITIIITVFLVPYLQKAYGQDAPVSTIDKVVSYTPVVTVPVTVSGFSNVGSCNLQILYDPAIATCVSVNLGPGVAGGIATNLTVPGVIAIGWYTWPGIDIDDGSVLFDIQFSRFEYGFTELTWDNDYYNRQWSNGDFEQLNDIPTVNFYTDGSIFFLTENAPVTIAPDIIAVSGESINVPVTVKQFNNIGSLSLILEYDNSVLTFQTFTNNSGFPGIVANESSPGYINVTGTVNSGEYGFSIPGNDTLLTLNFLYQGGTSDLIWNNAGFSSQYTGFPDYNVLNDLPTDTFYVNGSVNEAIQMVLKVFLEGPFNGSEMATDLKNNNLIPLSQPYYLSPWSYNGNESVSAIPGNTVDWVLVVLRESPGDVTLATSDKIISVQAGFLLRDGSVKSLDGINNLRFISSSTQNLFVVIYHRNHIPVISTNPVPLFNSVGIYDFSSGESQVYGGASGHKQIKTGVWGMAAGDSNGDGTINNMDKQNHWSLNAGMKGYLPSDFSLNARVDNQDKNDLWLSNMYKTSQVPE